MTHVVFSNDSVIDKRAITIMGVSSKDGPSAIGFFGTGLKYAIATILRNGMSIKIHAGLETLEFSSRKEKIRNDEFEIVLMNGQELGFTTALGRKWEVWQAFREIYSNCLDESGEIFESEDDVAACEGKTIIQVYGSGFLEKYHSRFDIFIDRRVQPYVSGRDVIVYPGSGIFYRGVLVKDKVVTRYRYNISRSIDLTEDRTAKYDFQVKGAIRDVVVRSVCAEFIEEMVTMSVGEYFEGDIDYEESDSVPSDVFMHVVGRLRLERMADLKLSAWKLYLKHSKSDHDEVFVELNDIEAEQLRRAVKLSARLGFGVDEYPIVVCDTLGDGVLALADREKRRIMLTRVLFCHGVLHLSRALIEEYIHIRHGYDDCTREMQNYIFDRMVHFGMASIGEVA